MIQSQFENTSLETVQQTPGLLDSYLEEHSDDPELLAESLAIDLMEDVVRLLQVKGISRSDLSGLMNVSRAYVTRLLNSPPNLTLMSVARLSIALNARPYIGLTVREPMYFAMKIADAGYTWVLGGKVIAQSAATGFTNADDVVIMPDRASTATAGIQFGPVATRAALVASAD